MSTILRTLAALSLVAALGACGQLTGAKDKAGEGDATTAEGSAEGAKPDEDAKPPTPEQAPAGAQPDKPT